MKDKPTPTPTPAHPATPVAPAPTDSNGLAIASLVLGIVSYSGFFILTGIPAIITGILALRKGQKERAMSIAGIILGAIASLLSLLFILFFILMIAFGASMGEAPRFDDHYFENEDSSMPVDSTRT